MKNILKIGATFLLLGLAGSAFAQGTGQLQSGQVWGNSTGSKAPASGNTIQQMLNASGGGLSSLTLTGNSANIIAAGQNGTTNPAFRVNASTASSVTGILVTSRASGNNSSISAISGATDENLNIDAKGVGAILLNASGTGGIFIQRAVTYGGVTLNNAVTGTGNMVLSASPTLTGTLTAASANFTGSFTQAGSVTITSNVNTAFVVGQNGTTGPAFTVDDSTALQATGLKVLGGVTGGATALIVTDTGSNASLTINAKGTGTIGIGNVSTGAVTITPNVTHSGTTTLSGALTYGGVTLTNNVTGTGKMVLDTSPTMSGVTVTGSFTATGLVTFADMATAALATTANYFAAAANTIVPTSIIYTAETTTTFGTTTTFDFSTFINTAVTLTGNITTQTLSNVQAGKAGTITFIQDGTGSRTTVWNSIFKFSGGVTPVLSTTAAAADVLSYSCRSATFCAASLIKDVR